MAYESKGGAMPTQQGPDMSQMPSQYGATAVPAHSDGIQYHQPDPYAQQRAFGSPPPPGYASAPMPATGAQGQYQQQQQPYQQHPVSPQQSPMQQQTPMQHQQQQAYFPPQQQQQQAFMNTMPLGNLGASAAPVLCPSCGQRAMTRTMPMTGNTTHAWAAGLCFFLCIGCVAYLISGTKDVVHNCGNCGVRLATWHRSGRTDVHMHG